MTESAMFIGYGKTKRGDWCVYAMRGDDAFELGRMTRGAHAAAVATAVSALLEVEFHSEDPPESLQ